MGDSKIIQYVSKTILINGLSVRTGGAQTFLVNLLPCLADINPEWEYHLLIRQDREHLYRNLPKNVIIETISNNLVDTYLKRFKYEHFIIPRLHRSQNFSLHFQVDEMLSPVITALLIPTITVFHTTPMILFDNSTGDSWVFRQYARHLRYSAAKNTSIPITVSHHAKAEFSGLYPFARDRFRVVYHGIDLDHFSPGKANIDLIHQLGITRPYVLSISNRFEWKNYFRLIQAYHQLIQFQEFSFDLVLVGEPKKPTEEKRIAEYIQTNALENHIHLLDFIPQAELPELYRAASAYIFPSMRETFGLTVLEAMACGVPVACARWGPLPEVAGDAACYFNPLSIDEMAEAMHKVSKDSTFRNELIDTGYEHIRYFTWKRAAKEYAGLMAEIFNDN